MTQYISTVRLSSGEVEIEHDENATDEEIKELALQKAKEAEYLRDFSVSKTPTETLLDQEPIEIEEPEEEDLAADLVQAVARPFTGLGGLAADAVNLAGDLVGVDEDIISEDQSDALKRAFIQRIGSVAGVRSDRVLTDDNEYKDTTTLTGDIATVAPYFIGGVGVAKGIATVAPKLPALVNGALSGLTIDQVLYQKGEDTIAGDVFEPEGWEEGTFKDIVEFMSVDEDDSMLEARVKLALEGLAIGGALEGVIRGVKGLNNFRLNRSASVREQSEAALQHLKESRQTAEVNRLNVHQDIKFSETPEGLAQIEQQNRGKFKYLHRFLNQVFKSRGYFTPSAYNAFRSKEYAERQLVREAENIATRLNKALDNLSVDKVPDQQRLNDALTAKPEDLEFAPTATKEGKAEWIAADFNLPKEVAIEIVEARELIDGLSARLANSSIPNEEFREIILENSGEYIRRSYRLFEDVNFKPDENLKLNVVNRLAQSYQAADEALTENQAFELALGKVNRILNKRTDMAGLDHYAKAVKVNKEILTGKKEIDEDIRRLMGEITDPADNILLTVGKMARLVETNQFADNLLDMGKNKYIFDDAVERNGVDYGVKITGTNSGLDGKFTTQEMATAIAGRQSHFDIYDASLVRSYAQLKGTSQAMKTVGSHITHLRNVLGGAQFGLANGINPFFKAGETRQILANAIRNKGEAGLDGLYEEYLGLGVINTNVRIGEFRKLMQAGSELDGSPRQFFERLKGYGAGRVAGKIYKGAEDLYMATDDFYKINAYERELKTLKKARPDANINDLKREAAEIVQNTLPNYDRVPPGVKSLRYLPIGSFVSFPAEILRTSTNIVKQSSKEIVEGLTTGNGALFQRGAQRLTGFTASMSAWKGMSVGAGMLAGLSQEEQDSIQKSSHTPWSKATRIPIRLADGTLFVADTQFLDSYSTIKEPVEAVMHLIMEGQLKGDALDAYLAEAVGAFTETVLRPYVGQSIITEAITDIGFAYFDDAGRTPDGEQIFASNESKTQKAINAFTRIGDSMVPGTVSSAFKFAEIDDRRAATGTTKGDYRAELVANFTGIRFTKLDPADKLFYSARNYLSEKRTYLKSTPDYEMDADEIIERKRKNLKSSYEAQQDLYLQFIAAEDLIGTDRAYEMLRNAGLSQDGAIALMNNSYYDSTWADQNMENILKMPETSDEMQRVIEEVTDLQYKYRMTDLIPVEEDDRAERADRLSRAKGGVVLNVPQAPIEPDERIDKMTGRPYNEQAGEAFTDEEDRIGIRRRLAKGGKINKKKMKCNKPRRTPNHPKKSHVVKACEGGKEKIIRFGQQGAKTAGKPKAGESKRMKAKRKSFKARHGRNIRKGKMSAAYWANKVKW